MIELKYDEEFAVLTIRRPQALNALSFSLIEDIGKAITEAGRSKARALIITGEGEKSFCAGADIKELQQRSLKDQREGAELAPGGPERLALIIERDLAAWRRLIGEARLVFD